MRVIDNSGRGRCMYYAYAISLMHHFKSLGANDNGHIEAIFDLLGVEGDERVNLAQILAKPGFFTSEDIRLIEVTLEPKLRKVSADKITADFIKAPLKTSLFAAMAYKFKEKIKAKIVKTHPDTALLIQVPDDAQSLSEFNAAEIFRVPGIHQAIESYTTLLAKDIVERPQTLQSIDSFIEQKIIQFFTANDQQQLKAYSARIQSPNAWGSTDSLYLLHALITGNEPRLINEYWEEHTERPINLKNFKYGKPAVPYRADESQHIILDNWANSHWVSQIPAKIDLQILLLEKPGDEIITAVLALNDEIDSLLSLYLNKPLGPSIRVQKKQTQETELKTYLGFDTATLKENDSVATSL